MMKWLFVVAVCLSGCWRDEPPHPTCPTLEGMQRVTKYYTLCRTNTVSEADRNDCKIAAQKMCEKK